MGKKSELLRTRREVLSGAAAIGVASVLRSPTSSAADNPALLTAAGIIGGTRSGRFVTKDGTEIYFNDWDPDHRSSSATAGHSAPTPLKIKCSFLRLADTAVSRTIVEDTAGRASRGRATIWIPMPMTSKV